jgi:phosphatidylinositol-3-phosphatase
MTQLQLRILAGLSLVCTLAVLGAGVRSGGSADASSALAAQRKPVTISAPGLGGSQQASGASASDSGDGSSDSGGGPTAPADQTGTLDTGSSGSSEAAPSEGDGLDGAGGSGPGGGGTSATEAVPKPTKVKHVFLIVLAGHGFDAAFGAGSAAGYLNRTLRPEGTLLSGYTTLGRADLPDELAMIGGQPPNASTRAGCPVYREIPPSNAPSSGGEVAADGCVFPNTVTTISDQLSATRRTWKAYAEDLDRGPAPAAGVAPKTTCRHPGSNAEDDTLRARLGDGYATRHNPFVYYHSLLDLGECDANDGALPQLDHDLRSATDTPSLSYIAPNLCDDGTESPCVDGSPGGLSAADAFLARWVPKVLASPAYRADGLLIVAFAGDVTPATDAPADDTGTDTDTTPAPAPSSGAADAPVREGALLVSRYAQAGASAGEAYDPYSLLRSLEDLFALRPLARAASATSFAPSVLSDAYATPPSDG